MMYRVVNTNTGVTVGFTEQPRFIKKSSDGVFVQTDEQNAQGIAFESTPYNLRDREGLGVEETVMLIEIDPGENLTSTETTLAAHSQTLDDLLVMTLMGGDE